MYQPLTTQINQILKLHALQHIKTNSSKIINSINAYDWVITGVAIPKDKTKSIPLANEKVRSITKSEVSF